MTQFKINFWKQSENRKIRLFNLFYHR